MQSVVLQFVTLYCHNKKSDRNITPQTAIANFMTDKFYDHNKLFVYDGVDVYINDIKQEIFEYRKNEFIFLLQQESVK